MSDTKSDTPNASTRKSISITSSLSSSPSYIKRNLTTEDNRSKDEGNSKKLKLCTEETSSSSSRAVRSTSDNKSHSSDRKDSSQSETGMGRLIADHYNKSKNDTVFSRRQSPIFHLRAFNNFIKSLVIDQMLEKMNHIGDSEPGRRRVIDIGCGKGGDLRKYMVNNVGYLLCTDIAEESLEKCKQRYEELKRREARCRRLYDIDYVHADSTRERLLDRMPHARHSFDLALMQFAFHYSFETLEQAQQLLQNVSDSLKDGGYFVGTTVDALQVISRARHLKTNEIKNDLYRIRLPPEILDPKWRPPLFGFRYDFQLHECVDCPEFMVYFPVVMRLAAAVGLKLVFFDNFVDYFAKKISDENRSLLFKMNGFQTYPPDSGSVFDAREFAHAEQYLRSYPHLRNDGERIGTLSASEWEIASLYCVFAFQKRS